MRELYYGHPARIVRHAWPQAPLQFYCPLPDGFGSRVKGKSDRFVVRDGHNFERRVFNVLTRDAELRGWYLFPEFKFSYKNGNQMLKSAYVDILAIQPVTGQIYILETKRTHTPNSYSQIWKYMALAKSYFGDHFAISGFEICLHQGLEAYYPGPHTWICPGQLRAADWNGRGLPEISIVPWYTGDFFL